MMKKIFSSSPKMYLSMILMNIEWKLPLDNVLLGWNFC
jgi:hypothetical protein